MFNFIERQLFISGVCTDHIWISLWETKPGLVSDALRHAPEWARQ